MPLSPVTVERWALHVDSDGTLDWLAYRDPLELPEEWVLRQLADADLEDDDAVAALLGDGLISRPFFAPMHVLPDAQAKLAPASGTDTGWWRTRGDGTLEDARWWLKTARALAGVWSRASNGEDPTAAWAAEGFLGLNDDHACWALFTLALDEGLRPFRARVEYRQELPNGGEFVYGLPQVGLYSAACRQVFNFLVEQQTARRCENATCGRIFTRQLGGSKYGQHRSKGIRFCSPSCARAETQRQYRRRKASQDKETNT